jgi:hypothetical protein
VSGLPVNDLVETFHQRGELFRSDLADATAYPLDGQGPDLAYLHPCLLAHHRSIEPERQRETGLLLLAVLISMEDFQRRFIDRQTEERRKALMDRVLAARAEGRGAPDSVSVLRALRGELT